jgi:hypothetical protein
VRRMYLAERAVFVELQFIRSISLIFGGCIIPLLTC